MAFIPHPNQNVRQALVRLTDALCSWEQSTGIKSVLIIREAGGFVYRAVNGKSNVPNDVEDSELIKLIQGK